MGSEPKASLRVQALKKRLDHHPNGARMFEYASTLDGWIHEWARYAARKDLARDERSRALGMLSSMRRDFNALLAEADAYDPEPKSRRSQFGTALDELGDEEKMALSQILGVPFERQYRALFEVKAAEYLEQDALWNEITEEGGFVDTTTLLSDETKGAVVLTYSGSLLLVSSPIEKKNFRRKYVYQSIYAGHLPTEGTLGLLEPIRKNLPISGTRIKTSPVRKIRVSRESSPDWDRHRETFFRLHKTLNDAATPSAVALRPPDHSSPDGAPNEVAPPKMAVEYAGAAAELNAGSSLGAAIAIPPAPPRPRPSAPGEASPALQVIPPAKSAAAPAGPTAIEAGDEDSVPPDARISRSNTYMQGTPKSVAAASPGDDPSPSKRSAPISSSDNRIPSIFVQVLHTERQRDHVRKLEETARAELRTLLARLIDTAGERDHGLEAEIIGQVMYLQRLAIERGELSVAPTELVRFETENNDLCTTVPDGLAIGKLGAPSSTVSGAHFGSQTIVRGAPIAILAKDSSLFAVLGNVRSYVRKS